MKTHTALHMPCGLLFAGDWFCEPCKLKIDKKVCDLCPVEGGALRQTKQKGTLVHILCAQWIPEIPLTMGKLGSQPIDTSCIPSDRRRLNCTICKTKHGACIQCQMPTCTTSFHAKCAVQSKYRMDLLLSENEEIIRKAFCQRHNTYQVEEQVLMTRPTKAGSSKTHNGKLTEFCDYVNVASGMPMWMACSRLGFFTCNLHEHGWAG